MCPAMRDISNVPQNFLSLLERIQTWKVENIQSIFETDIKHNVFLWGHVADCHFWPPPHKTPYMEFPDRDFFKKKFKVFSDGNFRQGKKWKYSKSFLTGISDREKVKYSKSFQTGKIKNVKYSKSFQTGIPDRKKVKIFKVFSDGDFRQGNSKNIQSLFGRGFQTGKN